MTFLDLQQGFGCLWHLSQMDPIVYSSRWIRGSSLTWSKPKLESPGRRVRKWRCLWGLEAGVERCRESYSRSMSVSEEPQEDSWNGFLRIFFPRNGFTVAVCVWLLACWLVDELV